MAVVDAMGMVCPQPVIMAARALDDLVATGAVREGVDVLVDNMVAVENLKRLAASRGCAAEVAQMGKASWRVAISIGDVSSSASVSPSFSLPGAILDPAIVRSSFALGVAGRPVPAPSVAVAGKTVAVGAESMGNGNRELGSILMKGLIYAFANASTPPAKMVFFNGGARLTCMGSASIDDLKELEAAGCEILTCGTCLDFYGIKDELAVGGVTNLYQISEMLLAPEGVVSL